MNIQLNKRVGMALLVLGLAESASADHGRDYLMTYDDSLPSVGGGFVVGSGSVSDADSGREKGFELQYSQGVTDWASLSLGFGYDHEGASTAHSVTPQLQLRFNPMSERIPLRFGFAAGYSFARVHGASVGHSHSLSGQGIYLGHLENEICGPAYGPDAPPCTDTGSTDAFDHGTGDNGGSTTVEESSVSSQGTNSAGGASANAGNRSSSSSVARTTGTSTRSDSGSSNTPATTAGVEDGHRHEHPADTIHVHGENHAFSRFIVAMDVGERDHLAANLIAVLPEDRGVAWGYALGFRHDVSESTSVSLEAMGDFDAKGYQEVGMGFLFEPVHHLGIKFGVCQGLTDATPDYTFRFGIVKEFH